MRAKKSLGQNFLVDVGLQRKIVEALDCSRTDTVLEIGSGRGALTRHLVGRAGHVVLVELDDRLAGALRDEWGTRSDVDVLHQDFLELDWAAVVPDPTKLLVVGNIPYNITAPIIFKLLERPRPRDIVLMVQREVAERLAAEPDTRDYGALTVGVRCIASVEKVLRVPRTAFRPVPGVDSTVVRITPFTPPPLSADEERSLRVLTRAAFTWRRKQMQKILRDHEALRLSRDRLDDLARETGWDLTRRPETLSPDDFVRLSGFITRTS
ncbi:MAG: 16S rRNA (adenine(1518)-N(6)/adenine(1519)-N(6))-dimethyltransferase RsmA [Gemmatimonadota bacterium]|nr:16S rRNA (adenine(1518)-N(6)/adenine(1519)-N(6))-dimethyltransferase RsmA [Gemmatimonadota bacterium]